MATVLLDNDNNITAFLINPVASIQGVVEIPDDDPRIVVFKDHHQAPTAIPDVTKRQMLIWLHQNLGKTDQDIQAAIQTIPDPDASAIALITWLHPDGPFRRSDPLFDELAPIFGLSVAQVDAAFVASSKL